MTYQAYSKYKSYTTYGNVNTGEHEFALVPTKPRSANVTALLFHGSGHPFAAHDTTQPNFGMLAALIAEAGIPVITAEFGGQGWGKPGVMTMGDTALTYMHSICGTRTDACITIGASMGAYTALRYAATNPSKVLAVAGIIPLTNMTYFYGSNIGGAQSEIAGAWGVTAPAALPTASQVQEEASTFNMPIKLWYSHADALIRPADTTAFAAAAPHCTAVDVGANGHSDATGLDVINYGAGDGQDVVSFLLANGAE